MRILFLTGRELGYSRNMVIADALKQWGDVDIVLANDTSKLSRRLLKVGLAAIIKLARNKYDLIFIGFYGHLFVLLVRLLSNTPILFDAFISTYDTLCFDRKKFSPKSPIGRLAFWLDKTACNLSNRVLLDTPEHIDYFVKTFALNPNLFAAIPVGCDESIFYPRNEKQGQKTTILFYTTYLPIHGIETVIKAAAQTIENQGIVYIIIGDGRERVKQETLAKRLGLSNITFLDYMPIEQLANEISRATICLGGHFSTNEKAQRVIPGKIYQFLCMGKPVIASNSPANQRLLDHLNNAILCYPNEDELARAIILLAENPSLREFIGLNGRETFQTCCDNLAIQKMIDKQRDHLFPSPDSQLPQAL